MNSQREVIYKRRKHARFGDRLELDIQNMFRDLAEQIVINNREAKDYDGFKMDLLQYFGMDATISENDFSGAKAPELIETIYKQARQGYKRRMESCHYLCDACDPTSSCKRE